MSDTNALQVMPAELLRLATDVAGVCKEIVTKTAVTIQGRKYVKVEGWMSIATAHGCVASARDVQKVDGGVSAVGEVRRISDGVCLATGEGFVGEDEPTWYGGVLKDKTLPKRADYAIRAMAQTRAISRACRTAFAHVVVMMDAELSTTPAEEVPFGGFNDNEVSHSSTPASKPIEVPRDKNGAYALPAGVKWQDVKIHFGKNKGTPLGKLEDKSIEWYATTWEPKPYGSNTDISSDDKLLLAAANSWLDEKDARGE